MRPRCMFYICLSNMPQAPCWDSPVTFFLRILMLLCWFWELSSFVFDQFLFCVCFHDRKHGSDGESCGSVILLQSDVECSGIRDIFFITNQHLNTGWVRDLSCYSCCLINTVWLNLKPHCATCLNLSILSKKRYFERHYNITQ